MNRVIHFDLYVDDPERASRFYSDVFGWKIEKWNGPMDYWLIMTGEKDQPGIDGGMSRREGDMKKVSMGAITISVADIDEAVSKVKAAGGKIEMEKDSIPGVGWFANFKDPEGNVVGMMQMDESVK